MLPSSSADALSISFPILLTLYYVDSVLVVAFKQRVHLKYRQSVILHHQRWGRLLELHLRLDGILERVDGVRCRYDFEHSIPVLDQISCR